MSSCHRQITTDIISYYNHQIIWKKCAYRKICYSIKIVFNFFPIRSPRKTVTWSPRDLASTSPSWFPSSSPSRSVLISLRRSAHVPAPTPGRSRSPLSRSGVTCPPRSPAWLKFNNNHSNNNNNNNILVTHRPGLRHQRDYCNIALSS